MHHSRPEPGDCHSNQQLSGGLEMYSASMRSAMQTHSRDTIVAKSEIRVPIRIQARNDGLGRIVIAIEVNISGRTRDDHAVVIIHRHTNRGSHNSAARKGDLDSSPP